MIAYKLVRKMKDGSYASLFINKTDRLEMSVQLQAEEYPTKGFAVRKGWHCTAQPSAPHLSEKGRVWVVVSIEDYTEFKRPQAQGGMWYLADKMIIIGEVTICQKAG